MIVKTKTLMLMFLIVFTLGTISVLGILQTTERVPTSGIVVLPALPPAPIMPPSTGGSGGSSLPPPNPEPSPDPVPEPNIELGFFRDAGCTTPLTSIEWGILEPGGSTVSHIYIRNSGDMGVEIILDANNWYPQGSDNYMSLSWNYDGTLISPGEVRHVVLTLSISATCPAYDDFWVNIIIYHS